MGKGRASKGAGRTDEEEEANVQEATITSSRDEEGHEEQQLTLYASAISPRGPVNVAWEKVEHERPPGQVQTVQVMVRMQPLQEGGAVGVGSKRRRVEG